MVTVGSKAVEITGSGRAADQDMLEFYDVPLGRWIQLIGIQYRIGSRSRYTRDWAVTGDTRLRSGYTILTLLVVQGRAVTPTVATVGDT